MRALLDFFTKPSAPKLTPIEKEVAGILKLLEGTGFMVTPPVKPRSMFTILKAPPNLNFKLAWIDRIRDELDSHDIGLWKTDHYIEAMGHQYVLVRGNLMMPIEPF